jgi:hypothetical protein
MILRKAEVEIGNSGWYRFDMRAGKLTRKRRQATGMKQFGQFRFAIIRTAPCRWSQ